jgi:hypothetical protein
LDPADGEPAAALQELELSGASARPATGENNGYAGPARIQPGGADRDQA